MKNIITTFTIVLMFFSLVGCKEQIIHNLSETESNRLITRLHSVGISAEKRAQADGTWALAVSRSDAIPALSALSDARVFRKSSFEKPESNTSMLPSRETQRFQFERAIAGEIEVTLSALHGVLESRVHLHLPPTDPLFGREIADGFPSSASVLLVTDSEFREDTLAVQHLVAGASGVRAERVSVLLSRPKIGASIDEASQLLRIEASSAPQAPAVEQGLADNREDKLREETSEDVPTVSQQDLPAVHELQDALISNGSGKEEEHPLSSAGALAQQLPTSTHAGSWSVWVVTALFLLILGLSGVWLVNRSPVFQRKRGVRAPRFEDQLQGLSFPEERAV